MTIPKNHPHWKRMRFKRNKIWVAVDADGRLILENSKALIKYQLNQEHEYWVHAENLAALDNSSSEATRPGSRQRTLPQSPPPVLPGLPPG